MVASGMQGKSGLAGVVLRRDTYSSAGKAFAVILQSMSWAVHFFLLLFFLQLFSSPEVFLYFSSIKPFLVFVCGCFVCIHTVNHRYAVPMET